MTNMPNGPTKYIHLERNTEGQVVDMKEVQIDANAAPVDLREDGYNPVQRLRETVDRNGRRINMSLKEAFMTNPDAANMLRSDIRFLAFERYAQMQRTFEPFTWMQGSNKPEEEYLRDSTFGVLPKVPSGTVAPELVSDFEGGVKIVNSRYGGIASVTGDMIRFDQIGKIRQIATGLGRAGRMTEEHAVYSYLTTTGNYTRNSTTKDNDIGANQQSLTWGGVNLETAMSIISTAKDRKSGAYLGFKANTVICGPRLEIPVKQLLLSTDLNRQGGNTTNEQRGGGDTNQYRGLVSNIIVTPWVTLVNDYNWILCDSTVDGFTFQTVEPFNVYQEDANVTSEAWLTRDMVRYLVQGYFGLGFVDDRAWVLSTATAAAAIS